MINILFLLRMLKKLKRLIFLFRGVNHLNNWPRAKDTKICVFLLVFFTWFLPKNHATLYWHRCCLSISCDIFQLMIVFLSLRLILLSKQPLTFFLSHVIRIPYFTYQVFVCIWILFRFEYLFALNNICALLFAYLQDVCNLNQFLGNFYFLSKFVWFWPLVRIWIFFCKGWHLEEKVLSLFFYFKYFKGIWIFEI